MSYLLNLGESGSIWIDLGDFGMFGINFANSGGIDTRINGGLSSTPEKRAIYRLANARASSKLLNAHK